MNKKIILAFVFLCGLAACKNSNTFYSEHHSVSPKGWLIEDAVRFDVQVTDTTTPYDVYIILRQNTSYEWMNTFLFLKTYYPNHEYSRDTIELLLANESGKWLGKGSSHIKENIFLFKPNIKFPQTGPYIFEFQHGMRTDSLKNIEDIGLKIVKSENNI